MEKALVTGATGFIGQYLVKHLLNQGYQVRLLLRDQSKRELFPSEVEVYVGDLRDAASLNTLCVGIDVVFHLAGYAHAKAHPDFARLHHELNFKGTQYLLDAALFAKVKKFVYFSTVKAIADDSKIVDETCQSYPQSPYGLAKRAAEDILLKAGNQHKINVSILRPALVYGPHFKGNLASMLHAIAKGRFLPLPEVKQYRSMVSVDDICRAAIMAAENPLANGKIYFVTDNVSYSTRDIYQLMMGALGKKVPNWSVPLNVFRGFAMLGDCLEKILHKPMPFNAETLDKLFGQALYSSRRIQEELAFEPKDTLETILPLIVKRYQKREVKDGE